MSVPTRSARSSFQVYWELPPGGFFPPIPFYEETVNYYYSAYNFIGMIETQGVQAALSAAEEGFFQQIGYDNAGNAYEISDHEIKTVCLPVPQNQALKVVVRDADTGEITDVIDVNSPPAGESLNLTGEFLDFGDIVPPRVLTSSWNINPVGY